MTSLAELSYLCDMLPSRNFMITTSSKSGFIFNFINNLDFLKSLFFIKNHTYSLYDTLIDIVMLHFPGRSKFQSFFILGNLCFQSKIFLSFFTSTTIISTGSFFKGANWIERECWDMFGVFFLNHFDLRRILTDYGFAGHPLKKDFPLTGYFELRYDEISKSLIYELVELSQELREFKFANPWTKK